MGYILGGILLALAVVITSLVLLQQGKDKNLSGAIAGGADTFFGKSKGANNDKLLSTITAVASVIFAVVVVVIPFVI